MTSAHGLDPMRILRQLAAASTKARGPPLGHRAAAWTFLVLTMCVVQGLGTSGAWAQQAAVQGIVIDQVGAQPLPAATVILERAGQEVRSILTDRNGLFQITGLAAGVYRLRIISFGYATHEETINLEGGQRLTVNRR